jgi:Family of unknown function (DUF5681)
MTDSKKRSAPSPESEVGYRNPPLGGRFQPGQSGNPRGRPRGSRNFRTDLKSTLSKPVKVNQDGKPRKISTQAAALLRLREKALGGDPRALDRLISLAQTHNNEEVAVGESTSAADIQVLEIFAQRVLSGAAGPYKRTDADSSSGLQPKTPDQADEDPV